MLKDIRSLSTWPVPSKLPPVMDPSEKSWYTSRIDLIGIDMSLENQKHSSETYSDPAKFICVDPYEINPLVERTDSHTPLVTIDIPLKGESSAIQQNISATSGSVFYGNQRKIKLEMEEFGDLSSFLPKPMLTNSVDELNTPTFEKDAFDFDISSFQKNCQTDFFVKLEYDANYRYKNITPENNINIFNEPEEVHRNESIPSEIGSNIHLQKSDTAMYSPVSDDGTYIYTSQSNESPTTISYNVNASALSVKPRHCSYPSSPVEVVQPNRSLETPDDSFSSYDSAPQKRKLSLDINQQAPVIEIVSTPNIIADVVDLESANFNILDLVEDDNIPEISADDIFGISMVTSPQSSLNIVSYGHPAEEEGNYEIGTQQPPKRLRTDHFDEDYVPPTKRKILHPRSRIVIEEDSSDYESDYEVDSKSKPKRRGRPPKRTASISSDHSKDSDPSKYRELRDKNNEASRKSRLKRKIKELEIETEADVLTTNNIKLKAQVDELEKIIKNYKDNIFKIMLNK